MAPSGAAGLSSLEDVEPGAAQRVGQQPHLRGLARPVAAFERDEQPGLPRRHARDAGQGGVTTPAAPTNSADLHLGSFSGVEAMTNRDIGARGAP